MKTEVKVNGKAITDSKDLDKAGKITSASISIENERPNTAYNLEGFDIEGALLVATLKKMQRSNATEAVLKFERVGKLLGYDLHITLRSPDHKPPTFLEKLKNLFN